MALVRQKPCRQLLDVESRLVQSQTHCPGTMFLDDDELAYTCQRDETHVERTVKGYFKAMRDDLADALESETAIEQSRAAST